jgi:hypothetical protein
LARPASEALGEVLGNLQTLGKSNQLKRRSDLLKDCRHLFLQIFRSAKLNAGRMMREALLLCKRFSCASAAAHQSTRQPVVRTAGIEPARLLVEGF